MFCHDYDEFATLTTLRETMTDASTNFNGKYFKLKVPIVIAESDGIPGAAYDFLYIRKVDPYRSQVGDIDFVMPPVEYEAWKARLKTGDFKQGARIFERMEDDMIELWLPDMDVASYVVTTKMADRLAGDQ